MAGLAAASVGLAACGSGASTTGAGASPVTLRLGYLTNLTHAPALVGVDRGFLQQALGAGVTLKTQTFNAGPTAVEAMFAGALDAAYLGPNSAINAFSKSHGDAVRIVSGATVGGAALVVRSDEGIHSAADLRGKHLASPQLGNTQDVALRTWLLKAGLHTTPRGGGDVLIAPTDNAVSLQLFEQKRIDGAWVPEPWASRLVDEGGGTVLVDEASLWPGGRFATTELVVTRSLLRDHPDVVRELVLGNQQTIAWMTQHPDDARTAAGAALARLTGRALPARVLSDAWSHLSFTVDPVIPALLEAAKDAHSVGLLASTDLHGIVDPRFLNAALRNLGVPPINDAGLAAAP
ncbi:MAG TPA: ABC transporter substrate-binding protein [Candidatus Dormibacteraeota bacterium]